MSRFFQVIIFSSALLLSSMRAIASPEIDNMSDAEVSEYAILMSDVLERIYSEQLCQASDDTCVRFEFARSGVAYDDKEAVKKRLLIMLGSIY